MNIDGSQVCIGETVDFCRDDPWSQLAIRAVETLYNEGELKGDITLSSQSWRLVWEMAGTYVKPSV